MITNFAMKGVLVGSVSLSSFVYKSMFAKENTMFKNTKYLKNHAILCSALEGIWRLKENEKLEQITLKIEWILQMFNENGDSSTPWIVNRLCHNVVMDIKNLCDKCKRSKDIEVLNVCVDCEDEFVPAIESQFEMLLHNLLLKV